MKYMKNILKKTSWISILESIIFAILGLIIIFNPEGVLVTISCILGVIFILIGIGKIINYFLSKGKYDFYNYNLIYGLMACILGIITIIYGRTISSIFRIIIGIWIIYSSFIRMNLSIELKTLKLNIWIYSLILAVIMFICGLYITMNSGAVIVTIGIFMVVCSIIDIIEDIIFLKSVKEY